MSRQILDGAKAFASCRRAKITGAENNPVYSNKFSILIHIISDGTIIWNFDSCRKGSDPVCVCNREKLFFGLDPNTCQRIDDVNTKSRIKKPGFELDNNGNNYSTCHLFVKF